MLPAKLREKIEIEDEAYFIAIGRYVPNLEARDLRRDSDSEVTEACWMDAGWRTSMYWRFCLDEVEEAVIHGRRCHAPRLTAHIPVLLGSILEACAPSSGHWLDGTFGAGGYARGLLDGRCGTCDGRGPRPNGFRDGRGVGRRLRRPADTGRRHIFRSGSHMSIEPLDGVVLDLGVSSMQMDHGRAGILVHGRRPA